MQNGTYTKIYPGQLLCERGEKYFPVILQRWSYTGFRSDTYDRNNGRRMKPPALPRYGTESYYRKHEVTLARQGKLSDRSQWSAYGDVEYRTFGLDETVNTFNLASYLRFLLGSHQEVGAIAMNRARADIMSSKAQLAVDLVELRKTKEMVAKAGMDLYQAFRDLKRGRPFSKLREEMNRDGFSSYAGNKWLEFIYGWAPTVSSAYEVADVLAEKWQDGSIVKGKVKATVHKDNSYPLSKLKTGADGLVTATCRTTCKVFYQYTIVDKKLVTLSQLGFTNPAAIVWELLPWSFVIDWFVDVGGYINRMDYALGIGDVWAQRLYHWRLTASVHQSLIDAYRLNFDSPHTYNIYEQILDRKYPESGITNTFRGLKPFTNESVRLTSAVALLNQQRVRLKT